MTNVNIFNEEVGLLKKGMVVGYDPTNHTMLVKLSNAVRSSANPPISVSMPHSTATYNQLFVGALPAVGTTVVVGQGSGGEWFFVSYYVEDSALLPTPEEGQLLLQAGDAAKIKLEQDGDLFLGSDSKRIHINTESDYSSQNFSNQYSFTKAGRSIEGIIKRDLIRNTNFTQSSKLDSDIYEDQLFTISMDPTSTPTSVISGANKNPPFVEKREITYEFQYDSNISDDLFESLLYGDQGPKDVKHYTFPNRRESRSDTLSLSLVSPNFLMETVKGTVVDIFGNILDLNRNPIPVGRGTNTLRDESNVDKTKSFLEIKALERKSLAYHWEINTRKNLSTTNGQISLPDLYSNENYSRDRSRFFVDIDKEGQFKINIPASSEVGNVPLHTRYENYSTFGKEDDGNPNKLIQLEDNRDIFQDSYAAPSLTAKLAGFMPTFTDGTRGSISLETSDGATASPKDRLTDTHMRHGMVYHDILQTCFLHQNNQFIGYQTGEVEPLTVNLANIPELKDVASSKIIVDGPNANAGGRSGSINMDGSLELNIGANTVDRQSLWLDTAGGMVANIGRDINGRSIVVATGGDVYFQVGGFGVSADSRFQDLNNGIMEGVLDLRISGAGGYCHMIRVDRYGVTILTPGAMKIHSKSDMVFTSDKDIRLECNTLVLQERMHMKAFGGSS